MNATPPQGMPGIAQQAGRMPRPIASTSTIASVSRVALAQQGPATVVRTVGSNASQECIRPLLSPGRITTNAAPLRSRVPQAERGAAARTNDVPSSAFSYNAAVTQQTEVQEYITQAQEQLNNIQHQAGTSAVQPSPVREVARSSRLPQTRQFQPLRSPTTRPPAVTPSRPVASPGARTMREPRLSAPATVARGPNLATSNLARYSLGKGSQPATPQKKLSSPSARKLDPEEGIQQQEEDKKQRRREEAIRLETEQAIHRARAKAEEERARIEYQQAAESQSKREQAIHRERAQAEEERARIEYQQAAEIQRQMELERIQQEQERIQQAQALAQRQAALAQRQADEKRYQEEQKAMRRHQQEMQRIRQEEAEQQRERQARLKAKQFEEMQGAKVEDKTAVEYIVTSPAFLGTHLQMAESKTVCILEKGAQVSVLEEKEIGDRIRARVFFQHLGGQEDSMVGYVSIRITDGNLMGFKWMMPIAQMRDLSTPAELVELGLQDERPGQYIVTHPASVGLGESLSSGTTSDILQPGTEVNVLEVIYRPDEQRMRGRIDKPYGFISLRDMTTHFRWAHYTDCWVPDANEENMQGKMKVETEEQVYGDKLEKTGEYIVMSPTLLSPNMRSSRKLLSAPL